MSEPTDEPTEPVDAVDPVESDEAAEPTDTDEPRTDPVRTVTRKGAAVGMAVALAAGGLVGWLGASTFDDDDDGQPISALESGQFPGGRFPGGQGGGGQGGGGFPGGPGGGFPGGGDHEGRPSPPWMDDAPDDGRRDEGDQGSSDDQEDERDQDSTQDDGG